jgi:PPOX class probable F420-dependent enzyme
VADEDPLGTALRSEGGTWAREHLETDVVAWFTTVGPDGTPQPSVIAFLWVGETIIFYSQPDTPKLTNIARSPAVSFHLQSDAHGDHVLILTGTAEIDPTIPPSDRHPRYAAKYRDPLAHWQMDEAATARTFSVPVRIRPQRVRVW